MRTTATAARVAPPISPASGTRLSSRTPVVFTQNVFAVIDDGRAHLEDYLVAEQRIREVATKYPSGVGCIVVIPAGAKPPPEPQRRAIEGVLTRLSGDLRGLVWVVEGGGFQAAAVRGVLMGLALYGRRLYPTRVCTSVPEALGWLASKLDTEPHRLDIERAAQKIKETRATYAP